jgi:hypothetical protein
MTSVSFVSKHSKARLILLSITMPTTATADSSSQSLSATEYQVKHKEDSVPTEDVEMSNNMDNNEMEKELDDKQVGLLGS